MQGQLTESRCKCAQPERQGGPSVSEGRRVCREVGREVLGREMSVPEDRNRGDHRALGPGQTGLRQAHAYRPRPELVLRRCVALRLSSGLFACEGYMVP